jgi:hypothetical protein
MRAPSGEFLLFAASQPDRGEGLVAPVSALDRFLLGKALSNYPVDPVAPRGTDGAEPRYFPGEQGRSVRIALEIAETEGRRVRLIDVSAPGDRAALVDRFVGAGSLLPLLIAPSGRRLEGPTDFIPSRLTTIFRE